MASSDLYYIETPSVESVRPEYGPISGGTIVTITGTNLDIGNKENTKVLFRELSANRRKKKQICPERKCVIE